VKGEDSLGSKGLLMEILLVVGFLVIWFVVQKWLLPKAGVPT
jgi:hypothetical protein